MYQIINIRISTSYCQAYLPNRVVFKCSVVPLGPRFDYTITLIKVIDQNTKINLADPVYSNFQT